MVAGHRRLHASGLAGKDTIPAIVRNLTDDEAVILLVDTNLQRENISPMERAQAYKMKMEALKHQGQRTDLHKEPTSCQVGEKSAWAIAKVSEDAHQSERQVHRYLRLTELVPEIQKKVDAKEIAFNPAVELSYLKPEEQKGVLDAMEYSQNTPIAFTGTAAEKTQPRGKMHAGRHVCGNVRGKEGRAGSRDTEKRYTPKIFPQELHAAANGTGHYQAAGSVAEKTAASERAVKDIQKKVGHPARRKE